MLLCSYVATDARIRWYYARRKTTGISLGARTTCTLSTLTAVPIGKQRLYLSLSSTRTRAHALRRVRIECVACILRCTNEINAQIPMYRVRTFGFTLADRNSGPFSLEVAWIGAYLDRTDKEILAYERYRLTPEAAEHYL